MAAVNGAELYYELAGKGQPLVFVHGNTLDHRMWDAQWEVFTAPYRVLRYDMRGYGRSTPVTDASYSHSADLRLLVEQLGLPPVHVCGLSLGGAVAVDFVVQSQELVRSLIAVDSGMSGYPWNDFKAFFSGVLEAGRQGGIEAARTAWLSGPLFAPALTQPAVEEKLRQIVGDFSGWIWREDAQVYDQSIRAIDKLASIQVPVLSIVGELDMEDFRKASDLFLQRVPGAQQRVLPDVGHMSNMEAPEVFNRELLKFLQELK